MGLSRNKVAVPEGAAGSPPFYGDLRNHCVWFVFRHNLRPCLFCECGVVCGVEIIETLWYGHAFGFPNCDSFLEASPLLRVWHCLVLWLCGVVWWFENWIVDASNDLY